MGGELVFHNSIPLKPFLREIWVKEPKDKEFLEGELPKSFHFLIKVHKTHPSTKYRCPSYKVTKLMPNFCYNFDPYERSYMKKRKGYGEKFDFYRKLAYNCGMPTEEISK